MLVGLSTTIPVVGAPPIFTTVAPVKFVPVIVTVVPPAVLPLAGLIAETLGAKLKPATCSTKPELPLPKPPAVRPRARNCPLPGRLKPLNCQFAVLPTRIAVPPSGV